MTEIVTDRATTGRSFPGVVAAATEVQMAFQTLGRMIERPVDIGDRVNAGDVLARLDPEDLTGT
ncbi:biotin/lipoyl-binding protein, partial [Enterobacter hormaechei]